MHLGPYGRILVMAVAALVVLLAVLITACFVGPGCCGFEYLQRARNKRKKEFPNENLGMVESNGKQLNLSRPGQNSWLNNKSYLFYQAEGESKEVPVYKSTETEFNLKFAPFPVAPVLNSITKNSAPKLDLKLSYSNLNQDATMARLTVHFMEATCLPGRDYFSTLEPYLVLNILNNKWSLQKTERIVHTVQTRIVRHTHNPKFDQHFTFDVKKSEFKDWCLKLTIYDNDRLTRPTPLCEKRIYLKEIKNLTTENQVMLSEELSEVGADLGELLFGISYLPTAQRLSISVIKANRLKYLSVVSSLADFYPYVRVLMLNNQGRCLRKKKTCFKHAEDSPIFNETLAFDLSTSYLEQAVFLILLCSKSLNKPPSSDGSNTDTEFDCPTKTNKDKVLGTIAVGRNVKCTKTRDHWVMVMQNPRKVISVWQTFK